MTRFFPFTNSNFILKNGESVCKVTPFILTNLFHRLVSFQFYCLFLAVGTLFVGDFIRNWLSKLQSSLVTKLILDTILTVELVTAALEFGVIFQHFGILWWTAGLFMNCVYQITRWSGLTPPSPYVHLLEWIQGKQVIRETLFIIKH